MILGYLSRKCNRASDLACQFQHSDPYKVILVTGILLYRKASGGLRGLAMLHVKEIMQSCTLGPLGDIEFRRFSGLKKLRNSKIPLLIMMLAPRSGANIITRRRMFEF